MKSHKKRMIKLPPMPAVEETPSAPRTFDELVTDSLARPAPPVVAFMPEVRVRAKDFKGKTSRPADDLKWTAEHMFDESTVVKDAPSATAWGLLMMCRSNVDLMQNFWNTIWPRMLPTKAQFEEAERQKGDNGASIVELCEKFKRGLGIKDDKEECEI